MPGTSSSSENIYSNKTVTVHMILITLVCAAFGVINIASGAAAAGTVTLAMGAVVPVVTVAIRKRTAITTQGFFLSIVQLLTIIVISASKHEMQTMFALMLASMAVSAIYYNVNCLKAHWIVMDAACIIGIFAKSFFYGGETMVNIIKGIVSINVGAVALVMLIKSCVKFLTATKDAHRQTEGLVQEVNAKMEDVNRLVENQRGVVAAVSEIAVRLNSAVSGMRDVSLEMSGSAEEQQRTIAEITDDISRLGAETDKSLEAASRARKAAGESTRMLTENNAEVGKMLDAMSGISDSAKKIETIIKTIKDIAFQTNILALNASVEAARAGEAGKGFAVVADEVRSLASKSDEAAKSTSALITRSIQSVESGSAIAHSVAEKMREAIRVSEQSAEFSVMIEDLTVSQNAAMDSMREKMEQISRSVARGLDVSVKNSEIARDVAEEVGNLNRSIES